MAAYYGKSITRSSGAKNKGTASQAMDYLQDDHDSKRIAQVSEAELDYMARVNPGYKTEQEGGKIPLQGYGRCEGLSEAEMRKTLEESCKPNYLSAAGNPTRASEGYTSHVVTLPKELSLMAETDPGKAKAAIDRAVKESLEKTYPGKDYAAVSSVHTRNSNGEIHYHAHVLVGKFVKDIKTGKTHSINNAEAMGGNARDGNKIKGHWHTAINREMEKEFGIRIENRKDGKPVIHMPDGASLAPLNRASRRELEKAVAPEVKYTDKHGQERTRQFSLNQMDAKIYEIASRDRGKGGWNREAFLKAFPKEAARIDRFEKRVETLKSVGYISEAGKVTDNFRTHAEAKWGKDSPQLQQLRLELERENAGKGRVRSVSPGTPLQTAIQAKPEIQERVASLGISNDDVKRAEARWQEQKPKVTPEQRQLVQFERDLANLNRNEKAELKDAPLSDRGVLIDRYARERASLEASIERIRPEVEKSLKHPAFREAKPALNDIRQDEKTLARIDSRIAGLEQSRAEKLKTAETPQAADKINRWHDAKIRPLEQTREKLDATIDAKREELLKAGDYPTRDRGAKFTEKGRHTTTIPIREPQADKPRDVSRQAGESVLNGMTGHMKGLVKVVKAAMEIRDNLKQMRERIPQDKVQDLRRGVDVLTKAGTPEGKLLQHWRGRETDLAARFATAAKDPASKALTPQTMEAVKQAGTVGRQMNAADNLLKTSPTPVPPRLKGMENQIQLFNARAEAMGVQSPLGKQVLQSVSPKELAAVFKEDKALEKMSSGGDAWGALKNQAVQAAMGKVMAVSKVALEAGQGLTKSGPFGG